MRREGRAAGTSRALLLHCADSDVDLADRVRPLCEALAERYFADRYPGFDLEDADWPALRGQAEEVAAVLAIVRERVEGTAPQA